MSTMASVGLVGDSTQTTRVSGRQAAATAAEVGLVDGVVAHRQHPRHQLPRAAVALVRQEHVVVGPEPAQDRVGRQPSRWRRPPRGPRPPTTPGTAPAPAGWGWRCGRRSTRARRLQPGLGVGGRLVDGDGDRARWRGRAPGRRGWHGSRNRPRQRTRPRSCSARGCRWAPTAPGSPWPRTAPDEQAPAPLRRRVGHRAPPGGRRPSKPGPSSVTSTVTWPGSTHARSSTPLRAARTALVPSSPATSRTSSRSARQGPQVGGQPRPQPAAAGRQALGRRRQPLPEPGRRASGPPAPPCRPGDCPPWKSSMAASTAAATASAGWPWVCAQHRPPAARRRRSRRAPGPRPRRRCRGRASRPAAAGGCRRTRSARRRGRPRCRAAPAAGPRRRRRRGGAGGGRHTRG